MEIPGQIAMLELAIRKYPMLIEAVTQSPSFEIRGRGGKPYRVDAFPFGQYSHFMKADLIHEVTKTLAAKVKAFGKNFNYLADIYPGGVVWGSAVALDVGVSKQTLWEKPTGLDGEIEIVVGGPHGRNLYFRNFSVGDRIVLLDDVISTTNTVGAVVRAFRERGLLVDDVFCIVAKGEGYKQLEHALGLSIHALLRLDENAQIVGVN